MFFPRNSSWVLLLWAYVFLLYHLFPLLSWVNYLVFFLFLVALQTILGLSIFASRGLFLSPLDLWHLGRELWSFFALALGFLRGLSPLPLEEFPLWYFPRYLFLVLLLGAMLLGSFPPMSTWFPSWPSSDLFYRFLGTWRNPLNPLCHWLSSRLPRHSALFLGLHFFFLTFLPLFSLGTLAWALFIREDLSFFLLSLPILFLPQAYALGLAYFSSYVGDNLEEVLIHLEIRFRKPLFQVDGQGLFSASLDDFSFALTQEGRGKYPLSFVLPLGDLWFSLAQSQALIFRARAWSFSRALLFLRLLILSFLLLSWPSPSPSLLLGIAPLCPRTQMVEKIALFHAHARFCTGDKPGIYGIARQFQEHVRQVSQGAWVEPHAVIVNPSTVNEKGFVQPEVSLTTGEGTFFHRARKFADELFNGQKGEQKAISWPREKRISIHALKKVVPGSEEYVQKHREALDALGLDPQRAYPLATEKIKEVEP